MEPDIMHFQFINTYIIPVICWSVAVIVVSNLLTKRRIDGSRWFLAAVSLFLINSVINLILAIIEIQPFFGDLSQRSVTMYVVIALSIRNLILIPSVIMLLVAFFAKSETEKLP